MSTKELALNIFNHLSEEQLRGFIAMFGEYYDLDENFNDEAKEAMKSAYNDEDIVGPFDSVADLTVALNA